MKAMALPRHRPGRVAGGGGDLGLVWIFGITARRAGRIQQTPGTNGEWSRRGEGSGSRNKREPPFRRARCSARRFGCGHAGEGKCCDVRSRSGNERSNLHEARRADCRAANGEWKPARFEWQAQPIEGHGIHQPFRSGQRRSPRHKDIADQWTENGIRNNTVERLSATPARAADDHSRTGTPAAYGASGLHAAAAYRTRARNLSGGRTEGWY